MNNWLHNWVNFLDFNYSASTDIWKTENHEKGKRKERKKERTEERRKKERTLREKRKKERKKENERRKERTIAKKGEKEKESLLNLSKSDYACYYYPIC